MVVYHVGSKGPALAKSACNQEHTIAKNIATGMWCNSCCLPGVNCLSLPETQRALEQESGKLKTLPRDN